MYYFAGVISLVLAMVLQMSIGPNIQIVSTQPAFLLIPLLLFILGIYPRFLSGILSPLPVARAVRLKFQPGWIGWYLPRQTPAENLFRGLILGFSAGVIEGINSRFIPASIFSWSLTGTFLGLVSGPVNKKSEVARALLLFTGAMLQALSFLILSSISSIFYPAGILFLSAFISALYTTLLGIFFIKFCERENKRIQYERW